MQPRDAGVLTAPRTLRGGLSHLWTVNAASSLAVFIVAGVGWFYPLVSFALSGLSLAGMHDESAGFGYFYTLRRLYGTDENPWMPFGQTVGLVHLALHLLLTAAGYDPTQLRPRLDLWTYLAPAIPLFLTVVTLTWALQPIRSTLGRVLVAVAFLAVSYETALATDFQLTTSGYHPWVHLVAAVTLGWLLRLARTDLPRTAKAAGLLGVFAGLTLGIKPSYLPFPAMLGMYLLLHQSTVVRAAGLAAGGGLVTVVTYLLLTWAVYLGRSAAILHHLQLAPAFVTQELSSDPPGSWVIQAGEAALRSPPSSLLDPRLLMILTPALIALGLLLPQQRRLSAALLVGSLVALYAIDRRPSPSTYVETYDLFVVVLVAWLTAVIVPAFGRIGTGRPATRSGLRMVGQGLMLAALCGLSIWLAAGVQKFDAKVRVAFTVATEGERQLQEFLAETSGRTLFAFVDYGHRPISIDSAIYRGGMTLGRTWQWNSAYVRSIANDRMYVLIETNDSAKLHVNPKRFQTFVYSYYPALETEAAVIARIERRLDFKFDSLDCPFTFPFWDPVQPPSVTLSNVQITRGCRRPG
ncbi:MAG: hypothetical protein AB7P40_01695 [Chloroflexota bacterium]